MIQAQMADGTVLQFPEGTADAIIDKAASEYAAQSSQHPSAPATESGETPTVTQSPATAPAAPSWDWQAALAGAADVVGGMARNSIPGMGVRAARSVLSGDINPAKIGGAMAEGWRATPPILTPEAQAHPLMQGFLGRQLYDPILSTAGGVMGAGNALLYGGAELVNEATGDPRAGRDALMLGQVASTLAGAGPRTGGLAGPRVFEPAVAPRVAPLMETFNRMDAARAAEPPPVPPPMEPPPPRPPPPPPPPTPASTAPAFVPPGTDVPTMLRLRAALNAASERPPAPRPDFVPPVNIDPLTGQVIPVQAPVDRIPPGAVGPATVPYGTTEPPPILPREPPPVPPPPVPEPPGPRSAGAAASRDMTDPAVLSAKTPAQALTDFTTSVQQTVRDRSRPGERPGTIEDHNVYVPEVRRLESARVFDPEIAGNHDALMDIDKPYETAVTAHEQGIHDILKDKYQRMEGNDNSVQALKDQRAAVSPDALGVFENERPVSAQPILDIINEIRDSPTGKIEAVTNTLNRIEKSLYDKNGNLEALPSRLYGARRNLTTIRDSKALTQEASDAATARRELGQVLPVMDRVIGSGSTGYSDVYLPQWANLSRLIDQQSYLQSKTLGPGKITGPTGNLTANGMQKLLEQIAKDKKATGNNPAKTLTEDQLNEMIAIRNELAAMQYRDNLAKSHGSPTVKKAAATARLGAPVMGLSPDAIDAVIHTVLAKTTLGAGNAVYQFGVKPILEKRRERAADTIMTTTRNKLLSTDIPSE